MNENQLPPLPRDYQREPEAERHALELLALSPNRRLERLKVCAQTIHTAETVEALVCVLRWCRANGEREAENSAVMAVVIRARANILAAVRRMPWLSSSQGEDFMEELIAASVLEWCSTDERSAFWEARFWVTLKRRILDAQRATARRLQLTTELARDEESDEDPMDRIADTHAPNPETQSVLASAFSGLPEHERLAFVWVRMERMPEKEAAERLGVTDRSVRNYIARAERKLKEWYRGEQIG